MSEQQDPLKRLIEVRSDEDEDQQSETEQDGDSTTQEENSTQEPLFDDISVIENKHIPDQNQVESEDTEDGEDNEIATDAQSTDSHLQQPEFNDVSPPARKPRQKISQEYQQTVDEEYAKHRAGIRDEVEDDTLAQEDEDPFREFEIEDQDQSAEQTNEAIEEEIEDPENTERTRIPIRYPQIQDKPFIPDTTKIQMPAEQIEIKSDTKTDLDNSSDMNIDQINKILNKLESENKQNQINYAPTQIISLISGWTAVMNGMSIGDINTISTHQGNVYQAYNRIFKTIYQCIQQSSFSTFKWSYMDWLKNTALIDYQTLLYGIYCSTWPGVNSYDITCPKCNTTREFKADNSVLVKYATPEVQDRIKAILDDAIIDDQQVDNQKFSDELSRMAFLKLRWEITLPKSGDKIIFKIPTLASRLAYLKRNSSNDDTAQSLKRQSYDSIILAIDKYQIAGTQIVLNTATPSHWDIIARRMEMLTSHDGQNIKDTITKQIVDRFGVEYSLNGVQCRNPECRAKIKRVPIDMEQQLFLAMSSRSLI